MLGAGQRQCVHPGPQGFDLGQHLVIPAEVGQEPEPRHFIEELCPGTEPRLARGLFLRLDEAERLLGPASVFKQVDQVSGRIRSQSVIPAFRGPRQDLWQPGFGLVPTAGGQECRS